MSEQHYLSGQHLNAEELSGEPPLPFAQSASVVEGGVKFAGFWIRLLAFAVDGALALAAIRSVALIAGINVGLVLLAQGYPSSIFRGWFSIGLAAAASLSVVLFYWTYFPSRASQATPGKRMCAIHIVRVDGRRVTLWLALGRLFSYFLATIPGAVGFLMIPWTDQRKGLHDIICATRVVHGRR